MNIKYFRWIEGKSREFTMIDPDYESPEETLRQLKKKFSDIHKIKISGVEYMNEPNGIEQTELLKKLARGEYDGMD